MQKQEHKEKILTESKQTYFPTQTNMTNAVNPTTPTKATNGCKTNSKEPEQPSSKYTRPVPTDVYTGKQFDQKVDVNECRTKYLINVDKKKDSCLCLDSPTPQECKYCDASCTKPLYMLTKQHLHDERSDTRGIQLNFNHEWPQKNKWRTGKEFTNFTTRCCTQRQKALHTLIKYVQGRSGYKNAKTGKKFVNAFSIFFCLLFKQHKPT